MHVYWSTLRCSTIIQAHEYTHTGTPNKNGNKQSFIGSSRNLHGITGDTVEWMQWCLRCRIHRNVKSTWCTMDNRTCTHRSGAARVNKAGEKQEGEATAHGWAKERNRSLLLFGVILNWMCWFAVFCVLLLLKLYSVAVERILCIQRETRQMMILPEYAFVLTFLTCGRKTTVALRSGH